jgi:AraC family transcriptional regulator
MKVEIIERKPATVAYLRHVGPYGEPIGTFWQKTVYPWMVTAGLLGKPRYGISLDDPHVTSPQQCRYDAGCEVAADFKLLGDAHKTTIPGGKYAAGHFAGRVVDFESAWTELLRDWLPSSGMQLDGRPMFEYYPEGSNYDAATGLFDCRLCVPVIPL